MTQIRNDHQLSSKELNKILPSYLLEEIDKEHHDNEMPKISNEKLNMLMNQKMKFNFNGMMQEVEKNGNENFPNFLQNNDNLYQYQCINNNTNCINNFINKDKFCIINNNDNNYMNYNNINSGNGCNNNVFVNIMNKKDISNKYTFCNYNNYNKYNSLSKDNTNINYNCFNINNINNINYKINKNNVNKKILSNNNNNINILNSIITNELNINCINIIQNNIKKKSEKKIKLEDFMKFINTIQTPIIDYVCNSKGALELQKMLEKSGQEIKIYFIQLLKREGLTIIMKNIHGNYFFQKLIKESSDKISSNILTLIIDDFINISKDNSGTFSIQALLSEISSIKDISKILQKIKGKEIEMIYDKNATYVIQKIVMKFPDIYRQELNEIILQNFSKLCLDVNGICLVKKFVKTNTIENDKQKMKNIITNNFLLLAQSPYGNYSIQFLLEKLNKNDLNEIFIVLNENIIKLSMQQFSSNVVEKALEKMDELNLGGVVTKLFFQGKFIFLLKNKFGKFVIKKAMNIMPNEMRQKVELDLINNINNGVYNNKDKNRVKKFLVKLQGDFVNNCNQINFNHFCTDININNCLSEF